MTEKTKRLVMSTMGVLIAGFSVGILKRAELGVDPFQAFMSGLDFAVPLKFGTLYVRLSLILLTFSFIADKHYIGPGTFVTLLFQGYVIDFSRKFFYGLFPVLSLPGRVLFLMIGICILCLASSLYITANLGVSTYDAISLIIAYTWKKGKFKYNRIITDLVCVCLGSALYLASGGKLSGLAAMVGAGTIITAFFMGPLIDFLNIHVSRPVLASGMAKGKNYERG